MTDTRSSHYHAERDLLPLDLGGAYVHHEPGPIHYYRDDVEITAEEYAAAVAAKIPEGLAVISPSLTMDYATGITTIVTPASLAGRTMCGLVVQHLGDHWECSIELVETEGPWAVMRSDQGPKLVQCERCLFRVPEADMEDSCVCVDCAAYD